MAYSVNAYHVALPTLSSYLIRTKKTKKTHSVFVKVLLPFSEDFNDMRVQVVWKKCKNFAFYNKSA